MMNYKWNVHFVSILITVNMNYAMLLAIDRYNLYKNEVAENKIKFERENKY